MRKVLSVWVCGVLCISSMMAAVNLENGVEAREIVRDYVIYAPHSPIRINSNADFTPANGVMGGDGTGGSPWIIDGWEIDGTGHGYCIYIGNTTEHFVVRNCGLFNASGRDGSQYYRDSGLYLHNVQNGAVVNNTIVLNLFYGINMDQSENNSFTDNVIRNSLRGVNLYSACHNNEFINNSILSNHACGFFLSQSENNTFEANNVTYNDNDGVSASYVGVAIQFNSNCNFVLNNIISKGLGISIYSSLFNTLIGNMFYKSGISVGGSSLEHWNTHSVGQDNTVNGNPLYYIKNQTGGSVPAGAGQIILSNCTDVIIEHQYIQNSSCAIICGFSSNNTIKNNTLSNNDYAIYFTESNDNRIFHNSFLNNAEQAYDANSNYWDNGYPSGGNYWSDYSSTDTMNGPTQDIPGSDGIGDTPYTNIGGGAGAQDNYPLMEPWGQETALIERGPIRINSNADFDAAHGVSAGDGSAGNPWIIENYDINGTGYGYCIYIGNTTEHFVVRNCSLHEASGVYSWPYFCDTGLIIYQVQNGIIANNTASSNNWAGIYLSSSSSNTITNNTASSNNEGGISLFFSNSNTIQNNTASSNNWPGIHLSSSSNNTIVNNTADNNWHGIELYQSNWNIVFYNIASSSAGSGIYLYSSTDNIVANNTNFDNDYGFLLGNSYDNTIINNAALNNNHGIQLYEMTSSGNQIYHNIFINNTVQAEDWTANSLNFWSAAYPIGGNYWSEYDENAEGAWDNNSGTGQDVTGSDGFADDPYPNIVGGAGAQDNYPLMTPGDIDDNYPPVTSVDVILPYWHNATSLSITATADDARSNVASVEFFYRYESLGWVCFGVDNVAPWTLDFNWPNGEGNYSFYSIGTDSEGNIEITPGVVDTTAGYDITPPSITDNSPAAGTTGDSYTVRTVVTDNMNLSAVHVIYWFGTGSETNATMTHTTADNLELGITIPLNSQDILHYRIAAVDRAGNWNATLTRYVAITDNDDPVANAGPDQTIEVGTVVTFNAFASTDNIGITNYTWTFTSNGSAITLHGISPSFVFTLVGNYTVTLTLRDAAGNTDTDTMVVTVNGIDTDGDCVPDDQDAFPNDPDEWEDTDGDGVGDNSDAFPNDPNEWADTDGDSVGNNADAFPTDPAASVDSDGDGYPDAWNSGMSVDDSTTGLVLDAFPTDPDETTDSDGDGVGDNSDAFPDDPDKWKEETGGIGDYWWIILILLIMLVIAALGLKMAKGKKPDAPKPEEGAAENSIEESVTTEQNTDPPKNE